MGYLAIARKWRPSRFEDLVGQGHVVQTLKNAIRLERVSHAYLFSGARGIGKTSVARIFAKALRCPNAKEAVPCNTCPECVAITESRSVDVVEIDGASNNGVEAVRGIRDNVAYSASSGFYKIYIIDEVHMLSVSAFNALLKTLEEPPKHVIFLFATTEVQKIPLTVLGRCQRFEFRRLTHSEITERLKHILAAEKLTVAEDGLSVIASHSDGSLRDALSLLDTVLSYGNTEEVRNHQAVTEKQVVEALGVAETSAVSRFLESILSGDLGTIVRIIDENFRAGVDLKHFAERCLEELRLLYLVSLAAEAKDQLTPEILDVSATRFAVLETLAKGVPLIRLERMAQILGKTISQLGWSSLPRFVLEMAAVRMSKLDALSALLEGQQPLAAPPKAAPPRPPEPVQEAPPAPPKVEAAPPKVVVARPLPPEPPPPAIDDFEPPSGFEPPPGPPNKDRWKAFVDAAMKKRPMLGALLCHANFRLEESATGRLVTVSFPTDSFYERQAMDSKNRLEIEELVKNFFGPETKLKLSSAEGETLNQSLEVTQEAERATLRKEAIEHPSVRSLKEALGAEIVEVSVEV